MNAQQIMVERVTYGSGQPSGKPSTVALLVGKMMNTGQSVTAAVEPRMARDIEQALAADAATNHGHNHTHVLAVVEPWQIVGVN